MDFLVVRTWATLTSFGARTTLSSFRTRTTLTTLRALSTWTTLRTLLIVGWLFDKYTMRELILVCLCFFLLLLHFFLVAFLDACLFHCLKTLPVNLADVEQSVLSR